MLDGTSVLNIGQVINELWIKTSENIPAGIVEQYSEADVIYKSDQNMTFSTGSNAGRKVN